MIMGKIHTDEKLLTWNVRERRNITVFQLFIVSTVTASTWRNVQL